MFTIYTYSASATAAQVLADLVAILTGTTDKTTLSASCVQASTTITSVIAAGWTVHDASAGTNAQCLKAPLADDGTKYKYVVIDTNTSGKILAKVYETWNETAHTGTNMITNSNSTTYGHPVSFTTGGVIYIGSSNRYLFLVGEYGTLYGVAGSTGYAPSGCFERTRMGLWDTVAKGIPPVVAMQTGGLSTDYFPRLLRYDNTTVTDSAAVGAEGMILSFSATKPATYKVLDESGNQYLPFYTIYALAYPLMTEPLGNISELCDIWFIPDSSASHLDTATVGSSNYIIMKGTRSGAQRFAVRAE